ncbi:MAG: cytochrome-c oxidase [Verrucomicrobia bacterium]|nr:MAG: cytochrome-c oxidase [Verrucomicrobiota bacterium]
MNYGPLLFLGAFFAMVASWFGLVLVPHLQLGRAPQAANVLDTTVKYPVGRPGQALQGQEVYRSFGCAECHTQQVRPRGLGADIDRGWGARRSVAPDYLYDYPIMIGNLRIGPDLMNFGLRETNRMNVFRHLYDPQRTVPGSLMPGYKFLFEERSLRFGQKPSSDALLLPGLKGADSDFEIGPKPEAIALVEYLLSLRADVPLFEVPPKIVPTNAPAAGVAGTNAPSVGAASTNSPAASTNAASK